LGDEAREPFACDPKNAATRGLPFLQGDGGNSGKGEGPHWKVYGGRKSELAGEQCGGSSTA